VTIVTPSYNQAEFLEQAILLVLEQDYPDVEYVVVDGGSTDGSVEIIRRYEDRLAWWTSGPDGGQVDAINRGFARSTGEFMGFLNSDDALLHGAISTLAGELERDSKLVLVYGDGFITDERMERRENARSKEWDPARMVHGSTNRIVQPATLWRRSAWELVGPLNDSSSYYFDFELWVRLAGVGPAKHVSEPLAMCRMHARSKTMGQALLKAHDAVRSADEFLAGPLVPQALRPHTRAGRAAMYRRAGFFFYQALELRRARRYHLRSIRTYPKGISGHGLTLLARSYLPRPLVRRLPRQTTGRLSKHALVLVMESFFFERTIARIRRAWRWLGLASRRD
jgi:glycosyltransferase involved in cell wall biosynthesis